MSGAPGAGPVPSPNAPEPWAYSLPIGGGWALVCPRCHAEAEQEEAIDPPDEDRAEALRVMEPLFDPCPLRWQPGHAPTCEGCNAPVADSCQGFDYPAGDS